MSDLMTYAGVYRSGGGGTTSTPHIMTKGKQFEIPGSASATHCIAPARRSGNPPRRANGKHRRHQQHPLEHAQVAFTNPNWRDYGASAPVIQPVSRGAITNIGTDHASRAVPNYAAPVTSATFHVRGGSNAVASPAFEAFQYQQRQQGSGGGAPAAQYGTGGNRYAQPFHAEAFNSNSSSSSSSSSSSAMVAAAGPRKGYATLAVGGGPAAFVGHDEARRQQQQQQRNNQEEEEEERMGGGGSSSEEEEEVQQQQQQQQLPMYWYAPSAAAPELMASPWHRDMPNPLLSDWQLRHAQRRQEAEEGFQSSGDDNGSTAAMVRILAARVESLSQRMAASAAIGGGREHLTSGTASADEEWLANAFLGLFVICVVDALRK